MRRRSRSLAAVGALIAVVVAAGRGSYAAGDEEGAAYDGAQLFKERCGSCHTLSEAGTKGTVGPDLDEALGDGGEQGFAESTIRDVVRDQIEFPARSSVTGAAIMPGPDETLAGIEDKNAAADAIAAYVASVPGKPPPKP